MGADKKVKVEDIEPLVHEYKGNVAAIARKFGVSRNTIWKRVQESPNLRAALDDARETMIDNAESKLYANVLDGDMTAIIFFLKTQGRGRGYVERQEITGADGGAIQLTAVPYAEDELSEWRQRQKRSLQSAKVLSG